MEVVVTPSGGTVKNLELTLKADRDASPTSVSSGTRVYKTATLSGPRNVAISVAIPSKVTSGKVTVTALAVGDDPKADQDVKQVTKTQALTVKKPKSSSSGSSGSSGSGGSSSSSGSSGSSSETTSGSDLPVGSGSDTTTTSPTGNPAVLPSIAPQTPSTAPGPVVQNTGNSQSMRGTEDAADQLTFDKLASTQAAWLAALLVAFSLLLTQVRLGRAAAAKDPRAKGAHRKTRRTNGAH
jgi:hypothetical protein